jgi:hypothetical protein
VDVVGGGAVVVSVLMTVLVCVGAFTVVVVGGVVTVSVLVTVCVFVGVVSGVFAVGVLTLAWAAVAVGLLVAGVAVGLDAVLAADAVCVLSVFAASLMLAAAFEPPPHAPTDNAARAAPTTAARQTDQPSPRVSGAGAVSVLWLRGLSMATSSYDTALASTRVRQSSGPQEGPSMPSAPPRSPTAISKPSPGRMRLHHPVWVIGRLPLAIRLAQIAANWDPRSVKPRLTHDG